MEVDAVVRTQTHDKMKMQVEPELELNHLCKNQVHTENHEIMHLFIKAAARENNICKA